MKKYSVLLMILAVAVSLCACGRKNAPATTPTTNTTEPMTTVPSTVMTDPTMDTNIPDPTVDSNSTENGTIFDDTTTNPSDTAKG